MRCHPRSQIGTSADVALRAERSETTQEYALHAVQKPSPSLDPDRQTGARPESEDRAGQTLTHIQTNIEQGGQLGGGNLTVEVDESRWMGVAKGYADKGLTVYVDGNCYANCGGGR